MNPEKSSMSATSYSRSNHLSLLHRGAEFFPALIHAIDSASVEIYLETYIFAVDDTANQVRDALISAASRGVMVYVLVDWLGTGRSNVALLQAEFEPSGVHFVAFNPWFQRGIARTHRKIVVIDQRLAFLGGLNINDDLISDDDSGMRLPAPRWDFAVSIIGPLVDDVHAEVATQWRRQSSQTLRRRLGQLRQWYASRLSVQSQVAEAALVIRDNLRNRVAIERQLLQALGRAHHSAVLVTPYFAPGRKLRRAMLHAATRGVDITLLIGVGQFVMQDAVAQSFYPRFICAGIRLVEYRATQLHAKAAVVDDAWATLGSSNFDGLSLFVNHEANIIVRDANFSMVLRDTIARGVAEGTTITVEDVAQFSWLRRVGNRLAYLLYRAVLKIITAGRYTK
jgi:cardiolipin synthase A/B